MRMYLLHLFHTSIYALTITNHCHGLRRVLWRDRGFTASPGILGRSRCFMPVRNGRQVAASCSKEEATHPRFATGRTATGQKLRADIRTVQQETARAHTPA